MSFPIVQRELFGALRTRRALIMLSVLTAAFSMIVMLRWPTDSRIDLSGTRSLQVFQVFGYALLVAVLFVTPSISAASIVTEKTRGTLALLLNSPLQAWSIYFGKFSGAILFSLLMLLTSVPAAAACYAMGGLDLVKQVGLLYFVLFVCVVQYTTLALLVSSYADSTDAAIRLTYAAVFALGVFSLGPYFLLQGNEGALGTIAWWLRAASPVPIVMQIIGHGAVGDLGVEQQLPGLAHFLLVAGLTSLAFAAVTISRLNFRIFDRNRSKGKITQDRGTGTRVLRRFMFLVDPQNRKAGIPFYMNPVMVKEFRTRRFGRAHWLMRLVAICAVLSLMFALAATKGVGDWGPETIGGFMVLFQMVLVVLIVPSLTSGLISTERESGGWDLLRMTPASSFKIVRGKLLSVVWTVSLILLATLPGYLVMIFIKPVMWKQVQLVLICLGLSAIYTICVGAAVSSLFRKTAAATMTCYVVLILLFLGPLLVWMGRDAPFSHQFVETALSINPTGAALSIIEAPGFESFEIVRISWTISLIVSFVALLFLSFQVWRITRPV